MTANPVDLITGLTTTAPVVKGDLSAWAKARVPQVMADATELRNTTLAGQAAISLKTTGQNYFLDTADTTTADDGLTCIISADGKRFKLLNGAFALDADGTLAANSDTRVPSQKAVKTYALPLSYLDTSGTLSANSDTKVPSQKAVKTYVDQIVAATDAMVFKGVIDCSANPNYPAADRGWTYKVSVAGKIGGASGINVEAGDVLLCMTDGTASGNQATVGAQWAIVQTNIDGAVTGPASSTSGNVPSFNGTGGKVLQDSGKPVAALPNALGRLPGVAGARAALTGEVGELVTATAVSGSAVALTTSTPANVTSIPLGAGDWDVWGFIVYKFAGTTTATLLLSSISTVSANVGDITTGAGIEQAFASFHPTSDYSVPAGPIPLSLSGTTTVYLVATAAFATSTCSAYGTIYARRRS